MLDALQQPSLEVSAEEVAVVWAPSWRRVSEAVDTSIREPREGRDCVPLLEGACF